MILLIVPILMMTTLEPCGSQDDEFTSYISRYPKADIPYAFGYADSLVVNLNNGEIISDSLVSRFITMKEYPIDAKAFVYRYYSRPIQNDSLIGVVYKKVGGSGGIQLFFEMVLYDARTQKLLDGIVLFQIVEGGTRQWFHTGMIDTDLVVRQESFEYAYVNERGRVLVEYSSNKLKISRKGFELLEGTKEGISKW